MITEDIMEWLATLPRWQQNIGYLILEKKQITEENINEIYSVFKIESGLENGIISDDNVYKYHYSEEGFPSVIWRGVGNVHGVNRLVTGPGLCVSDGMTVIYGENGSGKSGYTRLLNKAFVSRGDQEILPNIFAEKTEDVYAEFSFCIDGKMEKLKYPENIREYPFKTIRNFDSKSASDDMNKESTIDFAPGELAFFDLLLTVCSQIQNKLDGERNARKMENPTLKYFSNDGNALTQMKELSANTQISEIKKNFEITDEERNLYERIKAEKASLIALDINRQISVIDQVVTLLQNAIKKYDLYKVAVAQENIEIYNQQIEFLKKCKVIHDNDGMALFEDTTIELLGTDEWKAFISSAKKYYDAISGHDKCPLCGHDIKADDLIFKYWKYLESDAENNLKVIKESVRLTKNGITELDLSFLVESSIQEQWLLDNYRNEIMMISEMFKKADALRKQIIDSLDSEDIISINQVIDEPDIEGLIKKINEKRSGLNQESINSRIEECTKYENEYIDKMKVNELLPIIVSYVDYLKWDALAEKKKIKTRSITNKQKELFEKYVTSDYLSTFEEECKKLKANFEIEIVSRGSNGQTLKKLQIKGTAPGKVLSEGEQRAISIANFLTEVQMDKRNIGIVLDDPVCSLDHKRRSSIVKRLLEEANKRQVVIFTHEITFFMELKAEASRLGVEFMQETIRNICNEPGNISSIIPWQGMNVRERTGKLKNDLQEIIAIYNKGDSDQYYYKAKEWCELLRESWERAVEEILFNDAIQRYNPCVQTQRLKKAPFSQELYCELECGMTECSSWCHDQARAINGDIPDVNELKSFIECFEKYCKKYKQ